MAATATTRYILRNVFLTNRIPEVPENPDFSYSNNNVFERFLEVDLSGNKIECPVIVRKHVELVLQEEMSSGRNFTPLVERVSVPLYTEHRHTLKRTASSIFKFFEYQSHNRLDKVVTNKGEVYYGGKGIILNSEFKVLALCICEYNTKDESGNYLPTLCKIRVYIHPSVFLSNGLVEKGIIKTYIPSFIDAGFTRAAMSAMSPLEVTAPTEVEIIISDVTDKFIKTPVKPKVHEFTGENVNRFLLGKLDKIYEMSKL